jgi:hypothetical protein
LACFCRKQQLGIVAKISHGLEFGPAQSQVEVIALHASLRQFAAEVIEFIEAGCHHPSVSAQVMQHLQMTNTSNAQDHASSSVPKRLKFFCMNSAFARFLARKINTSAIGIPLAVFSNSKT